MIKTEYDIGQTVNLPWKVASITVTEDGTKYRLVNDMAEWGIVLTEHQITDTECISVDDYETEINSLKDEVNRQKEMYYLEHMKYMKLKTGTKNDEWRKLP